MPNYKLAAFDMDGTLLNSRKEIPSSAVLACKRAAAAGRIVALDTGRAVTELTIFPLTEMGIRYGSCACGTVIYDFEDSLVLAKKTIPESLVPTIVEASGLEDLMLQVMVETADGLPIIAPLRDDAYEVVSRLQAPANTPPKQGETEGVLLIHSLPYLEFGWLTAHARGIVTDSGNVAEEATFNGVPCITLNSYTEHQETVTVGSNLLVGGDARKLGEALRQLTGGTWKKCALPDRWDGRTAERIVSILLES